jgi:hypothetical protein
VLQRFIGVETRAAHHALAYFQGFDLRPVG